MVMRRALYEMVFHAFRRKQVLELLEEFRSQHARGVCAAKSFRQLLRIQYPGATHAEMKLWMDCALFELSNIIALAAHAHATRAILRVGVLARNAAGGREVSAGRQLDRASRLRPIPSVRRGVVD